MSRIGFFLLLILTLNLQSCIHDIEPEIPNEEELITTVRITFTPMNGSEVKTFLFQDIDGDGGNPPILEIDTFEAQTVYTAQLELYNEQYTPALNITEEVQEEGDEHQFFYQFQNDSFDFQYLDEDSNGNPIGLQFQIQTADTTNDVLSLVLRHQPDKFASGVSDGNIENAGGETDIQLNFDFHVE